MEYGEFNKVQNVVTVRRRRPLINLLFIYFLQTASIFEGAPKLFCFAVLVGLDPLSKGGEGDQKKRKVSAIGYGSGRDEALVSKKILK